MKYTLKSRFFLLKKDISSAIRANRKGVILGTILLLLGVALGIYIGVNIGEKTSPFGIFSALFNLEFAPFSYLLPDFLRFFLFSGLATLAYFLPLPMIYPTIAIFFFGKYFGELACVCFLSDSLFSAILSTLIVYLPLLLIGEAILLAIAIRASSMRLFKGTDRCRTTAKRDVMISLLYLFLYFAVLFILYVLVCGAIYLIMIAL